MKDLPISYTNIIHLQIVLILDLLITKMPTHQHLAKSDLLFARLFRRYSRSASHKPTRVQFTTLSVSPGMCISLVGATHNQSKVRKLTLYFRHPYFYLLIQEICFKLYMLEKLFLRSSRYLRLCCYWLKRILMVKIKTKKQQLLLMIFFAKLIKTSPSRSLGL